MTWQLFTIDPTKYSLVEKFVKGVDGVSNVVYKTVDSKEVTKLGKKSKKQIAVFPTYLFVDIDKDREDEIHYRLLNHRHIKRFIGYLGREDIEQLERIIKDTNYSRKFIEEFAVGDVVVILEGLLKNYEAKVVSVKKDEVLLNTDLNGKMVSYSIKSKDIRLVRRQKN